MRLAISMQKGGVGKTTTSINLGGALAARDNDVLLVDADPQGGSSLKLGYRDEYRTNEYALYDVLAEYGDLELGDLGQLILAGDEFDIVPSHLRNFRLEKHLYSEARGVETLRIALDRLKEPYDYILIDSPPNLGPLADGALLAAQNVLFPSHPNIIAQDSLQIAMVAGAVATGVALVPVFSLWEGNVGPILLVVLLGRKDILHVSRAEYVATFGIVGIATGAVGQALAIGVLGLQAVTVGGYDFIAGQVILAACLGFIILYVVGRGLLFHRYADDVSSIPGARRAWTMVISVFAIAYIIARTGIFMLIYG